jgi:predicted secreted protein
MANRSVGTRLQINTDYIAGLTSIGGIAKTADTLDTTTLDSDGGYRTFTGGFKDGGEVTISGFFEPGDTDGQIAMDAAFEDGGVQDFSIIFPSAMGASWNFQGVVTAFSTNSDLEELVTFEATIKVSGKPDLATTASTGLSGLSLTGTDGALSPSFANGVYSYAFDGVSASSVTITATAASHTLKLYIDGIYSQDLTSGAASSSIPLTLDVGKKLTVVAWQAGKSKVTYEVVVVKTS